MRTLPESYLEDVAEVDEDEVASSTRGSVPVLLGVQNSSEERKQYYPRSPNLSVISLNSKHDFSQIRIEQYTMDKMLKLSILSESRSRFGTVCKYLNRTTMTEYTVAGWDQQNMKIEEQEEVFKELDYLCSLKNHRVARIYGYHLRNDNILLMFRSFVPSVTVADRLRRGPLIESITLKYLQQLLEGLQYLHDKSVYHGNIKASNMLLTIANDIQLADPHIKGAPEPDFHLRRTLLLSAPELLKDAASLTNFTAASDIWAAGCVTITMLTSYAPFKDVFFAQNPHTLHQSLMEAHRKPGSLPFRSRTLIPTASREISEIVDAIFQRDPTLRPSATMLLDTFFSSSPSSSRSSMPYDSFPSKRYSKKIDHDDLYNDAPINANQAAEVTEKEELLEKEKEKVEESQFLDLTRWLLSRVLIFGSLLLKWIGMVLLAAILLALVAGSVFFAIFIIYNAIGVVCQCNLNEGFIVLIALILLPIIILLTTLCCNNSCEKYKQAVEDGELEKSKYVSRQPDDDIVLCGIIVVDGRKDQPKHSIKRKVANPDETDPTDAANLPRGTFVRGVARIA